MSLIAKLVGALLGSSGPVRGEGPGLSEEELAAAALLVHVARVDGVVRDDEREALLAVLQGGYGLDAEGAADLLERAGRLDLEVDDVGSLVEMLGQDTHGLDGERLLGVAYRVAAADGGLAEFEEDLLWRLGHLLGFDDGAIGDIRERTIPAGLLGARLRV